MSRRTIVVGSTVAVLALLSSAARAQPSPAPRELGQSGWFAGQRGFSAKLALGTAYRQLYTVPIGAADIDAAFGAQTKAGGWYGSLGLLVGSTAEGLAVTQIHLGPSWEAPIGPLHLGLSPQTSLLVVSRASADSRMGSATFGGAAFATVDVVSGGSYALTVGLKATVDALTDGDGPMWGGTAGLGLRLF